MSSFQLIQGNSVTNLDGIAEGYSVRDCISAENIVRVLRALGNADKYLLLRFSPLQ